MRSRPLFLIVFWPVLCILTLFWWNAGTTRPSHPTFPLLTLANGNPEQAHPHAYATLCVGDSFVLGTLVLFHSLRRTGARADFVALTAKLSPSSVQMLQNYGIRVFVVQPLQISLYSSYQHQKSDARDSILWTKLRVWQLIDYAKVVMLDSDLLALKNSDELFEMPEFASTPMVDPKEKTLFFKTSDLGLKLRNKIKEDFPLSSSSVLLNWSGVNSGVSVLKPDNATFTDILNELSILPNRVVRCFFFCS